jgi:uncharacterized membrane protein YtjA (UPF0391 family)
LGGLAILRWSLAFLAFALISGLLGWFHVEAVSPHVAWSLCILFSLLFVVSFFFGGRIRPLD